MAAKVKGLDGATIYHEKDVEQSGFDHLIETIGKELNAMMSWIPGRAFLRFWGLMGRSRRAATRRA